MPEVRELIEFLQQQYQPDERIAWSIWAVCDVEQVARECNQDIDEEDATQILDKTHDVQDDNAGLGFYRVCDARLFAKWLVFVGMVLCPFLFVFM